MGQSSLVDIVPYWPVIEEKLKWVGDTVPRSNLILFSSLIIIVLYKQWTARKLAKERLRKEEESLVFRPPIEPLKSFDWQTTEPIQMRPYKPKYHLTMGLENLDPSELIPMDNTYKDRIAYRRKLLKEHHDVVVRVNNEHTDPRVRAAVGELYHFVVATYLPTRYPQMFKLVETSFDTGKEKMLQNLVTGEVLPTELSVNRPVVSALETLTKTVDEEMLVLLPEQKNQTEPDAKKQTGKKRRNIIDNSNTTTEKKSAVSELGDTKYILEAYATCFPSGFDTREKLGKRLADIHGPVPGYKDKIEKSMDRYFDKLEVGRFVKRANWSVTTGADLFSPFGDVHAAEGEQLKPLTLEELDVNNTFLRCERQTVYRLPTSGAAIFSFHTYLYPIQKIKEEGSGEDLAVAIDGLTGGTVPRMADYKRMPAWGEAVKEYLRS